MAIDAVSVYSNGWIIRTSGAGSPTAADAKDVEVTVGLEIEVEAGPNEVEIETE